ncbi:pantothenate synthetase [Bradyrhizobium sp. LM3.4]
MSSRNRSLIQEERRRAGANRGGLFAARTEFQAGERDGKELLVIAEQYLETVDRLQYLELSTPIRSSQLRARYIGLPPCARQPTSARRTSSTTYCSTVSAR